MTKPLLHFAHANGVPACSYRKFLNALSDHFDVVAIPVIGTHPQYGVGEHWQGIVQQILESIREQGKGRPVIAIGHSMGGLSSYLAAQQHPELFRALIMLDPPIINGMAAIGMHLAKLTGRIDDVSPAGKSKNRREVWESRTEAAANLHSKALFKVWDNDCFKDYILQGLVDCPEGVRLLIPAATEVEIFRRGPSNFWVRHKRLRTPAAVMVGKKSEFAKTGFPERFARQQPVKLVYTEGGHMFPLERPIEVANEVRTLLQQLHVSL